MSDEKNKVKMTTENTNKSISEIILKFLEPRKCDRDLFIPRINIHDGVFSETENRVSINFLYDVFSNLLPKNNISKDELAEAFRINEKFKIETRHDKILIKIDHENLMSLLAREALVLKSQKKELRTSFMIYDAMGDPLFFNMPISKRKKFGYVGYGN